MDEELLSNLLNTSANTFKNINLIILFLVVLIWHWLLYFLLYFYYYDSKWIYGNVAFTRMHRKETGGQRGLTVPRLTFKSLSSQPCLQQTTPLK